MKIKINGYIENSELKEEHKIETTGIKKDNIIIYSENDVKTKIIIKDNSLILIRETNKFIMDIILEKDRQTEGKYYINELDKTITLNVNTNDLKIKENSIYAEYQINSAVIEYEITYKEM